MRRKFRTWRRPCVKLPVFSTGLGESFTRMCILAATSSHPFATDTPTPRSCGQAILHRQQSCRASTTTLAVLFDRAPELLRPRAPPPRPCLARWTSASSSSGSGWALVFFQTIGVHHCYPQLLAFFRIVRFVASRLQAAWASQILHCPRLVSLLGDDCDTHKLWTFLDRRLCRRPC
jgi:hypothetical protein